MGRLFLVRHGQASFLTEDYDRLSALGEEQSRLLGDYLARHGIAVDSAFTGPRKRQIDTGRIVGERLASAGMAWPEMHQIAGLDECHSELLLDTLLPELAEQHAHIREYQRAFELAQGDSERRKTFQRMFDSVMRLYIHGRFRVDHMESWADFTERVNQSIDTIIGETPRGGTAVAFTSGGPIAVAAQRALKTDPDTTLEFMWQSRNAAVTEFVFSGDRFTMSMYNAIPHLHDNAMWTHR